MPFTLVRAVWVALPAGSIRLRLLGTGNLTPVEAKEQLYISGSLTRVVTLQEAARGIEIPVADNLDSITVVVGRLRRLSVAKEHGLRLVAMAHEQPRRVATQWRKRAEVSAQLAESGCALTQQTSVCEGVTYSILPYERGLGNAVFQSGPGTGASGSIIIYFSAPVSSVTITVHDPTFPGNSVTALDAAGSVISYARFIGNKIPGTYSSDTQTLTGAISRVQLVAADADYVGYSGTFTTGDQRVIVSCGAATQRGDQAKCETSMAIAEPFTIIRRTARSQDFVVEDRTAIVYLAGQADAWEGTAITAASVRVEVRLGTGSSARTLKNAVPAKLDILPRNWPAWQLTGVTSRTVALVSGYMTEYPTPGVSDWGVAQVGWPDATTDPQIQRASSGPNKGVAFISNALALSGYDIGVHPALYPPSAGTPPQSAAWYNDQNGQPSGTCGASNIATLAMNVDRHEGATKAQNSHFGVANSMFTQLRPERIFEALSTDKDDARLRESIKREIERFVSKGAYAAAQANFDQTDGPIVHALGCTLDFNLNNP